MTRHTQYASHTGRTGHGGIGARIARIAQNARTARGTGGGVTLGGTTLGIRHAVDHAAAVSGLTPPGAAALAWGAACLLLFMPLGWHELLTGGTLLLALPVCSRVLLTGGARIDVTLGADPLRSHAGQVIRLAITVENHGRSTSRDTAATLPVGDEERRIALPPIRPRTSRGIVEEIVAPARTVLRVGPATVHRSDPLGLIDHGRRLSQTVHIYVHPVIAELPAHRSGRRRDFDGPASGTLVPDGMEFHGLDEARHGDDPRRVHWPASARAGRLMVRRYQAEQRTDMSLTLSTDPRHYANDREFELAVSVYASLGVQCLDEGRSLIPHAGDAHPREPRSGALHRQRFLDECSAIGLEPPEGGTRPATVNTTANAPVPRVETGNDAGRRRRTAFGTYPRTAASRTVFVTGSHALDDDMLAVMRASGTRAVEIIRVREGASLAEERHGAAHLTVIGALPQLSVLFRTSGPPPIAPEVASCAGVT